MYRKSFEQWMSEVNQACELIAGLSALDLPDVSYRDWYDDDVKPVAAARRALRAAME